MSAPLHQRRMAAAAVSIANANREVRALLGTPELSQEGVAAVLGALEEADYHLCGLQDDPYGSVPVGPCAWRWKMNFTTRRLMPRHDPKGVHACVRAHGHDGMHGCACGARS